MPFDRVEVKGQVVSVGNLSESRILIVDDQPENLKVLTTVLELKGYRHVRCLDDSRRVVPVLSEFQPDLILLDLHMPHVDGIAVMDQLGGIIAEDDYLPVLVLTGDNTSVARERALSHGAHDFISKPLNRTEVQLRVKNLLQTRWLHLQRKAQNASLEETNRRLREAQAHLVQSEKMASLGQLVAGIAHEVNNPLAFVINNLFLAQEGLERLAQPQESASAQEESTSAQVPAQLERVRAQIRNSCEGAERVKDLVSKLRTFSRLDEGKFKTVNIHESLESVLLFLRHKLEDRIEVERNYGAPDMLACYSGELNQVLMNVIANAIDSIEGQGKVTLTTMQQDDHFVIVVRDTGRGIPEEIRNKVFEPFFTTKPVGSGTGLGLAISYGILKAHQGSIDFSSEPGKGTEFMLRIPTGLRAEA
jgi:two-component system, NtrC family, sensor kinase